MTISFVTSAEEVVLNETASNPDQRNEGATGPRRANTTKPSIASRRQARLKRRHAKRRGP